MKETDKNITITAQAYAHALMLIKENYPTMPKELQEKQAMRLAAKICKR